MEMDDEGAGAAVEPRCRVTGSRRKRKPADENAAPAGGAPRRGKKVSPADHGMDGGRKPGEGGISAG
jgi:hypothetical protein